MALTAWQQSVVAIDVIGPVIFTGLLGMMRYTNRISRSLWLTYLFGIALTSIWEISFGLAGDSFLIFKFNNPLGFSVHILHAFWDSIILLFGMYFIHIRNDNAYCGIKQLVLLTIFGLLQEFIVEVLFNDKYWYYKTDNKLNPVLFTLNGVEYTWVPFLVWATFPILYLAGTFSIIDTYGPLRLHGRREITDDRINTLINNPHNTLATETICNSDNSTIL
jgi:hypothetical protein